MDRVADAGGDDPGVDIMHLENLSELADQVDTGHGDVVQTAWERENIGGSRAGGKQGLGGGVTTNRGTFIRKVYHLLKCGFSKPLHSDC